MMKIIDYVVKTSIVLAALLIMGYFFPVVSWFEKPQPRKNMVFRCEMVDGKVRDYTLNLPENVTWYVVTKEVHTCIMYLHRLGYNKRSLSRILLLHPNTINRVLNKPQDYEY